MITILSTLLGFFSSLLPQGLKVYQDIKDKQHEIRLLELQMEAQLKMHDQRLEEIAIEQDASSQTAMYKTFYSGTPWVDALNGLIRPVLTLSFFALYVYIKYQQYNYVSGADFQTVYSVLWGVEDQALFSSIIAFYFGNRTFDKLLNRRNRGYND